MEETKNVKDALLQYHKEIVVPKVLAVETKADTALANDANCVHKTGDETIDGVKKFNSKIYITDDLEISENAFNFNLSDIGYTIRLGAAPQIYYNDETSALEFLPGIAGNDNVVFNTNAVFNKDVYAYGNITSIVDYASTTTLPEITELTNRNIARTELKDVYTAVIEDVIVPGFEVKFETISGSDLSCEQIQQFIDADKTYLEFGAADNTGAYTNNTKALRVGKGNNIGKIGFDITAIPGKDVFVILKTFFTNKIFNSKVDIDGQIYELSTETVEVGGHIQPKDTYINITSLVKAGNDITIYGVDADDLSRYFLFYGIKYTDHTIVNKEWVKLATDRQINSLDTRLTANENLTSQNADDITNLQSYVGECQIFNTEVLPAINRNNDGVSPYDNIIYRINDKLHLERTYTGFYWDFAKMSHSTATANFDDQEVIAVCCNRYQQDTAAAMSHTNCLQAQAPQNGIKMGTASDSGVLSFWLVTEDGVSRLKDTSKIKIRVKAFRADKSTALDVYLKNTVTSETVLYKWFNVEGSSDIVLEIDSSDLAGKALSSIDSIELRTRKITDARIYLRSIVFENTSANARDVKEWVESAYDKAERSSSSGEEVIAKFIDTLGQLSKEQLSVLANFAQQLTE